MNPVRTFHPIRRKTMIPRGFTLVELLVVIAVLGILIALLIPSLGTMAHQSRVAEDTSNLRSLQMAHYQYAVDSMGQFAGCGAGPRGAGQRVDRMAQPHR
ncbi:MAG: hypothetical protein CMJ41_06655 [Phycisphaerae bacterium]|nr:hypothetical protein [Phycisphaerae bacterium]